MRRRSWLLHGLNRQSGPRSLWSAGAMIGLAMLLAVSWLATTDPAATAAASGPKVAIIVGPAGSQTAANKDWANAAAREALRHTSNVAKVYSPSATWSRVKAAMTGAALVVYVGRGYGVPSPKTSVLNRWVDHGFGLNPVAGVDNIRLRFYGEAYIRTARLAPSALVLLHRMDYASGMSPAGSSQPTASVAWRRVDNYGAGFLAAGASVVIAEASSSPGYYVRAVFTRNTSLDAVWRGAPSFHGNVRSFSSSRTSRATGRTDPIRATSGFTRSIIGRPDTRTSAVRQEPTSCGATLQSKIDAAPAGSVLNLPGCTYPAGATIRKSITILGGTIRPSRGTSGLLVLASEVTIDGLRVAGPQGTTYDQDEIGIEVQGTVTAPISGLTIRNCEIGTLGYGGLYIRHAASFVIENNLIRDGVYAGIMVISGRGGLIAGNTVQRIGVYGAAANENNAYGIALTRGGGDLSTDPRSADIIVSGNTVEDVPTWHAYDTHGGERITWTDNTARRSRSGVFITGSPSRSGTIRSLDNDVNGNAIYAPTDADHYAITSVYSTGGYVRSNTIVGWPSGHEILTTSAGDPDATAVNLTVSGNTITR